MRLERSEMTREEEVVAGSSKLMEAKGRCGRCKNLGRVDKKESGHQWNNTDVHIAYIFHRRGSIE